MSRHVKDIAHDEENEVIKTRFFDLELLQQTGMFERRFDDLKGMFWHVAPFFLTEVDDYLDNRTSSCEIPVSQQWETTVNI